MAKAKRKRRTFTLEEKQNILAEIEAGNKLVDVAKKYEMQPAQLSQWKAKYGKGSTRKSSTKGGARTGRKAKAAPTQAAAAPASTPAGNGSKARASRPVSSSRSASAAGSASIADLERMIGRLTVENALLRQQLEELGAK